MQSTEVKNRDVLLDFPPDVVEASVQVKNRRFENVVSSDDSQEFLISDLQSWRPGQTVRVAFLSGDGDLYRDVAAAIAEKTIATARAALDLLARGR